MSSATEADNGRDELLAAATVAWREWDRSPARIEMVSRSENVVFRVVHSSSSESFVLRIHRLGYHNQAELVSEQLWTTALNAAGVGAPTAVPALDGRRYVAVQVGSEEARQVGVSRWVEGEILWDLVEAADGSERSRFFTELGRIAAQIHNQAVGWRLSEQFRRHSFDVDGFLGESPFWGRFWEVPGLEASERRLISKAREKLTEILSAYGQDSETYSLIHGDLHAGNILKTRDGLHVIDFDDAGFGWHLYELAVAIFAYQTEPHFESIRDSLVAGYRSLRPLSDEALELLPIFLLLRALALLGWIDARPELDRRELFDQVRSLARRQAAALLE